MQCRPELGSEARCPEALREERLPTWAQAAAGRAAQSPGSPSTEEAACTGTDVPPRSPSWRLLDRDTEPKRRKPPGSKNPDSRALRDTSPERASPRGRQSEVGKDRQPRGTERPLRPQPSASVVRGANQRGPSAQHPLRERPLVPVRPSTQGAALAAGDDETQLA